MKDKLAPFDLYDLHVYATKLILILQILLVSNEVLAVINSNVIAMIFIELAKSITV